MAQRYTEPVEHTADGTDETATAQDMTLETTATSGQRPASAVRWISRVGFQVRGIGRHGTARQSSATWLARYVFETLKSAGQTQWFLPVASFNTICLSKLTRTERIMSISFLARNRFRPGRPGQCVHDGVRGLSCTRTH